MIPDSVRKGLMDALKENQHLLALRLHWLANVKDAVRLKQVTGRKSKRRGVPLGVQIEKLENGEKRTLSCTEFEILNDFSSDLLYGVAHGLSVAALQPCELSGRNVVRFKK